jgi:hypothetical protein
MSNIEEQERRMLWEQFCDVRAKQQESYDSCIRTLAAAGAAVTASLGAALHGLSGWGVLAIVLFLVSLGTPSLPWRSDRIMGMPNCTSESLEIPATAQFLAPIQRTPRDVPGRRGMG